MRSWPKNRRHPPVAGVLERALVLRGGGLERILVAGDRRLHPGEVEPGARRRPGHVLALVPALDRAAEQKLRDLAVEFEPLGAFCRLDTQVGKPADIGLFLGDDAGFHILHDGIGLGPAIGNAHHLGQPHRIAQDVSRPKRVCFLEEIGFADGQWEDRTGRDFEIPLRGKLGHALATEIGIGAAKGNKIVEAEAHGAFPFGGAMGRSVPRRDHCKKPDATTGSFDG